MASSTRRRRCVGAIVVLHFVVLAAAFAAAAYPPVQAAFMDSEHWRWRTLAVTLDSSRLGATTLDDLKELEINILALSNTAVSEKVLPRIRGMTALSGLELRDPGIDRDQLNQLREDRPDLHIIEFD